jgi:hypothetical protein
MKRIDDGRSLCAQCAVENTANKEVFFLTVVEIQLQAA